MPRSFRVDQVAGIFDVPVAEKSRLELAVDVPAFDDDAGDSPFGDWTIGAIVGPSGSGKSVVSREAFGKHFVESHAWPKSKPMIDAIAPKSIEFKRIADMLNAVGFSSPPAWVLPYHALSNGQRFRSDLARALLIERPVLAYDEFTSVVDRQVGQFASASIAKAVRKGRTGCKRFVAVTCHYDVLDWLEPDWVLDMSKRELARGCLQPRKLVGSRPAIDLEIRRADRSLWSVFAPHHYLSAKLHHASRIYAAYWRDEPIALCATLANAGHAGRRIIHRLVVLPDYQGLGVGLRLLDAVAEHEAAEHTMSIKTSHPALIAALRRRQSWRLKSISRVGRSHGGFLATAGRKVGSVGRSTASFEWAGSAPSC